MKREKWKCAICEREYDHEGMTERHMTDAGNNVCEYCLRKAAVYSVTKTTLSGDRFYASAEHNGEEIGTGWYTSKAEPRTRILEMIEKLWGDVEKVEE